MAGRRWCGDRRGGGSAGPAPAGRRAAAARSTRPGALELGGERFFVKVNVARARSRCSRPRRPVSPSSRRRRRYASRVRSPAGRRRRRVVPRARMARASPPAAATRRSAGRSRAAPAHGGGASAGTATTPSARRRRTNPLVRRLGGVLPRPPHRAAARPRRAGNGRGERCSAMAQALLAAIPGSARRPCAGAVAAPRRLWSGNAARLARGEPVIFDPACTTATARPTSRWRSSSAASTSPSSSPIARSGRGSGLRDAAHALQPVPRPESPQPLRCRLRRACRSDDRAAAGGSPLTAAAVPRTCGRRCMSRGSVAPPVAVGGGGAQLRGYTMERITMSIDEALAKEFDALIAKRGYTSRSEAMRDLLRREVEANRVSVRGEELLRREPVLRLQPPRARPGRAADRRAARAPRPGGLDDARAPRSRALSRDGDPERPDRRGAVVRAADRGRTRRTSRRRSTSSPSRPGDKHACRAPTITAATCT